jgi:hypothetical protein
MERPNNARLSRINTAHSNEYLLRKSRGMTDLEGY